MPFISAIPTEFLICNHYYHKCYFNALCSRVLTCLIHNYSSHRFIFFLFILTDYSSLVRTVIYYGGLTVVIFHLQASEKVITSLIFSLGPNLRSNFIFRSIHNHRGVSFSLLVSVFCRLATTVLQTSCKFLCRSNMIMLQSKDF